MTQTPTARKEKLFGSIELDAEGKVLNSRAETEEGRHYPAELVGRNFFSEVAPFQNIAEFRQHLERFMRSSEQAKSISFICQYPDGDVSVKIRLARVTERTADKLTKSVLVHIRQAQ